MPSPRGWLVKIELIRVNWGVWEYSPRKFWLSEEAILETVYAWG